MRPKRSPVPKPPKIETLFDADALRTQIAALGRRLEEDLGGEDPMLLALLGGSFVFFADLVRAIERPVRFELIHVGYYATHAQVGQEEGEVLQIQYPIPVDIEGQSVIVVKDVVGSGVTEPYLEQQLRDRGAGAVRFAALIDRPDERKTSYELPYSAFTTNEPGLLVGYGMKHEGRYGNLPYVGRLAGGA
ncbi:MAG TPA: phosphoribosyltransferase family protein [Thermoanaerobaculia bacterium]|nr:phosphoribosyltransferase family protein [Thermoanaerobaculia bacterium]